MGIENKKEFVNYIEAKAIAKKFSIKSMIDWRRLSEDNEELRIPKNPDSYYKNEWNNWYEFLGKLKKRDLFLSYDEASDFVKKSNITTNYMYREFSKKYENLPLNPPKIYDEWKSWGDFLGTFVSYVEAKEIIKKHSIKNLREWRKLAKNNPQLRIPYAPENTYKNDWIDSYSFFDKPNRRDIFLSYDEALKFIRKSNVTTTYMYLDLLKKNPQLPSSPQKIYDEWESWEIFLGSSKLNQSSKIEKIIKRILSDFFDLGELFDKTVLSIKGKRISLDMADFGRQLAIEYDGSRWHETSQSRSRDENKNKLLESNGWTLIRIRENPLEKINDKFDLIIPKSLQYRNFNDMVSFILNHFYEVIEDKKIKLKIKSKLNHDFTDYNFLEINEESKFMSYEDCQQYALDNNINNSREWVEFIKLMKHKPLNVPYAPNEVYAYVWKGWREFFSNKEKRLDTFVSYDECKNLARKMNIKTGKEWLLSINEIRKHLNVPSNPSKVYKNKGWKSWNDFFGTVRRPQNRLK